MKLRRIIHPALCLSLLATGCVGTGAARKDGQTVPLFKGMGHHARKVTTTSALAQRYFDQGLTWTYAFNHDEAIRSFTEAARLDPQCAMAWWGTALCHGPHINNPAVPLERGQAAWAALQEAVARVDHVTPAERDLIEALSHRYADPPPEDRRPLDEAYADAMREVWLTHRDDPDVGTLYAESMMNLRPWDLWTQDGRARPGTERILAVLEEVLRLDPDNPGANHLYIHAVEPSPHPDRANAAADRLRNLVPASGHLVHMPSHIDVLTGRWDLAAKQNERAINADGEYRKVSPEQGFYRVYMLHNHHMLAFAAAMSGRSADALGAARAVVNSAPEDYLRREAALVDGYMGAVYDALKRFARWDDILSEAPPPSFLPITTATWRCARALAYANKKQFDLAQRERLAFQEAVSNVREDAVMSINPAGHVLKIAEHLLDGEIALNRGDLDGAILELNKAVELEDKLLYMEPPEWQQPVRHTLGAVLLTAGRYEEAERVYRQDLAKWPGNGWALYGLSRALHMSGKHEHAKEAERDFAKAWARADVKIASSCLCVPRT